MLNNTNLLANAFWAVLDSTAIIVSAYLGFGKWKALRAQKLTDQDSLIESQQDEIAKRDATDAVKIQLETFEGKFDKQIGEIKEVLAKINYAIFNAGKTGLVNKVDFMLEKQAEISTSVEVLKTQIKPIRRSRDTTN